MFVNGISWILYSFQAKNAYIFIANIPSIPLSLYYYSTLLCLLPESKLFFKYASLNIVCWGLSAALSVTAACVLLDLDVSKKILATGILATIAVVFFYFSPLFALSQVLQTKNSVSIHFGLALSSLINSLLWSVYGLCVQDYFVMGPNVAGVVLGVIQLVLRFSYPSNYLRHDVESNCEEVAQESRL